MSLRYLLQGQLAYMKSQGFKILAISSDGPEREQVIKHEKVAHHVVPFTRAITPWQDLICLLMLIKLFRKTKPDIVHTHTPKAGLLGMWAAWFTGVPVRMHTVAGLPWMETKGLKRILLWNMERLTCFFATGVYPNSFVQMKFLKENKIGQNGKLKVIGQGSSNGIDVEKFAPAKELQEEAMKARQGLDISMDDLVFIFIGRIVKDKGINELVSAFRNLRKEYDNIHLILVGPFENDLDPVNDQTSREIEENPGIHAVGFQEDVRPWLLAADVLTFPSYREGFPNVPMQAGAMGLPAVVTDINGCNEIIKHNINGLIVPPKDEPALKEAMELLINDDKLRHRLASNARESIVSRFDRNLIWQGLLTEYQNHLSKNES
ncbi:MAG: glycosyltransferase family 4 protein [Cyclobacteriaceae bacterium]|nr:glycosyltransferase family 4 protein [Cyclobacteriaceae bacterium]